MLDFLSLILYNLYAIQKEITNSVSNTPDKVGGREYK